MINLGNAFGTLYLLFFLKDAVHYEDPDTGLLIMMGLYGVALVDRARWSPGTSRTSPDGVSRTSLRPPV